MAKKRTSPPAKKPTAKAPKGTLARVLSYLRGYRLYLLISLVLAISSVALTLWLPVLIGNAIPILTTAIFFILYIVYKANGSEDLLSVAGLIGGLGVGSFGILGEVVFMIFADTSTLLQIFISFAACVIVFMLGYAVGGPVARKDKSEVIKELEEERLRKEKKKAAKANAKNK